MQRHVELLRTLSSISPELADQLISSWGKADLHVLIRDITSGKDKRIFSYLSSELLRKFKELDEDHRKQFPSLAPASLTNEPQALALDQEYLMVSKRFPHIAERVCVTWGTPDFQPYLDGLLTDARIANRQGFPDEYRAALVSIRRKHDHLFPTLIHKSRESVTFPPEDRIWIDFPTEEKS
jgi:hypothetical protein